jgi:integrase/recombinase XerD
LYGSGLRIGEVLSLRFKDIEARLDETRLLENKEAVVYETKTNRERRVQLGEVAAGYLRLYLKHVRERISCRKEKPGPMDYIFVTIRHAEKLSQDTVNRCLKRFCRRAGIKKTITCHCFRHSFGTHLLENGAGIKEVSELLGHEDLTTTERYTRLNPEHLRQTILKYHPRETYHD